MGAGVDLGGNVMRTAGLRTWLATKPVDWSYALATRAALRVLPLAAAEPLDSADFAAELAVGVFGCLALSWGICRYPDLRRPVQESPIAELAFAEGVDAAALSVSRQYGRNWMHAAEAVHAAVAALRTVAVSDPSHVHLPASDAITNAAAAADDTFLTGDGRALWQAVKADAALLEAGGNLAAVPLWEGQPPEWHVQARSKLHELFGAGDQGWALWIDWYGRRVEGAESGFGHSPEVERSLLERLAGAPRQFWEQKPSVLNETVAAWLEERLDEADLDPEPQNKAAVVFSVDTAGRLDLDLSAGAGELRGDEDSADQYAELSRATDEAIRLIGDNAAAALKDKMRRLRSALGEDEGTIRPSLLVLYAEAVRQDVAARETSEPESDLRALSEESLLAARQVVSAVNLFIASDPALVRRDLALGGPDATQPLIRAEDVLRMLGSAEAAAAMTREAQEAIAAAAGNVPAEASPGDRRYRFLIETARNLMRKAASHIRSYRKTVAAASAIPVACYAIGRYVLANRETWLRLFADQPAMLKVVREVIAFLERMPLA